MMMNQTLTGVRSLGLIQSIAVVMIGAFLVFSAGFAQSQVLHDAAHDMRHSTGFPCH